MTNRYTCFVLAAGFLFLNIFPANQTIHYAVSDRGKPMDLAIPQGTSFVQFKAIMKFNICTLNNGEFANKELLYFWKKVDKIRNIAWLHAVSNQKEWEKFLPVAKHATLFVSYPKSKPYRRMSV